jgi:tetratricopeptide (TPR) repeat protein
MGVPARVLVVLGLAAAAVVGTAAASDRFVPADPHFVVANVRQAVPDARLRGLIADWRADPGDATAATLASAFLERAHTLREPMYVGRAEAVLAPLEKRAGASADIHRLYARTLQFRHDFAAAEVRLDAILENTPYDIAARTQRASVRLVRGDFGGARADCARLLGGGANQMIALACLAEALAGSGQLDRAQALFAAYPLDPRALDPAGAPGTRAYFLTVRGEIHERAQQLDRAIVDYGAALELAPADDSVRAALADALIAHGESRDADELLSVDRPSLALLVRRAACLQGAEFQRVSAQATAMLELESARGDAVHAREAALLAMAKGDVAGALAAARINFNTQKEVVDVRLLARAARESRDSSALRQLADWLHATGFRDAVTEKILGSAPHG